MDGERKRTCMLVRARFKGCKDEFWKSIVTGQAGPVQCVSCENCGFGKSFFFLLFPPLLFNWWKICSFPPKTGSSSASWFKFQAEVLWNFSSRCSPINIHQTLLSLNNFPVWQKIRTVTFVLSAQLKDFDKFSQRQSLKLIFAKPLINWNDEAKRLIKT